MNGLLKTASATSMRIPSAGPPPGAGGSGEKEEKSFADKASDVWDNHGGKITAGVGLLAAGGLAKHKGWIGGKKGPKPQPKQQQPKQNTAKQNTAKQTSTDPRDNDSFMDRLKSKATGKKTPGQAAHIEQESAKPVAAESVGSNLDKSLTPDVSDADHKAINQAAAEETNSILAGNENSGLSRASEKSNAKQLPDGPDNTPLWKDPDGQLRHPDESSRAPNRDRMSELWNQGDKSK